jgi:hypothetical protein
LEIVNELARVGARPGKPFDDEIADAIEGSRAMLLLFVTEYNNNLTGERDADAGCAQSVRGGEKQNGSQADEGDVQFRHRGYQL